MAECALFYVLLMTSSQTSEIIAEKNIYMADVSHFMLLILPCLHNKNTSFVLLKFVLYVAIKYLRVCSCFILLSFG